MNSDELRLAVFTVTTEAGKRITGDSARAEYEAGGENIFTQEGVGEQFDGLIEELLDTINWAAMTVLKLREAREQANRYFESTGGTPEELSRTRGLSGKDLGPDSINVTESSEVPGTQLIIRPTSEYPHP